MPKGGGHCVTVGNPIKLWPVRMFTFSNPEPLAIGKRSHSKQVNLLVNAKVFVQGSLDESSLGAKFKSFEQGAQFGSALPAARSHHDSCHNDRWGQGDTRHRSLGY